MNLIGNINAIPFRRFRGGGGVAPFPSIPGMIARYSALGLTNEQMAANPVWVDKTGNGHDLQMKNFAWKEGSGISDVYLGALVFDGVDDYGVCDNFPVLAKEKGYTVVALRQWITYNPNAISAIATNASDQSFNGAFTFENYNKGAEQTISYGATQITLQYSKSPFSWQTTSKYNGVNIANGNKDATNSLVLGRSCPQRNDFANFAIWELVFLDHDATEEELTKIKDYFVKTYPWLFPDQAWTTVGKTNEDEDRATIANITGNGNDLVLSNFGFAEGSGYGLYGFKFIPKAGVEYYSGSRLSFSKRQLDQITLNPYILIFPGGSYPKETDITAKIKVAGLKEGVSLIWGWAGNIELTITEDGTYSISAGIGKLRSMNVVYAEDFDPDHVVTIEQIPEYEGYLVTDGVDDKIASSAFEMGKDFTVVGEWKFLSVSNYNYAGIVKSNNLYVYNSSTGINIYVCSSSVGNKMEGLKSLKAICSDGRVYDDNWVEYKLKNVGDNIGTNSTLDIGTNENNFTKIAFKNLEIYNNKILSKEDCIKAYNYLQTLKAK